MGRPILATQRTWRSAKLNISRFYKLVTLAFIAIVPLAVAACDVKEDTAVATDAEETTAPAATVVAVPKARDLPFAKETLPAVRLPRPPLLY